MKNHNSKLVLILILLISVKLLGQELSNMRIVGNGEYLSNELISDTKYDSNGDKCSGLIILTDLPVLNFTSYNQIVDIDKLAGKYFLYLSPNERVVEVFSNDHAPLKIILSDYGISLKSGQVWQLKMTGERKSDLIPITIIKNQLDAFVYIDGELKGTEKSQMVSPGEHEIRITKTGYKTITDKINVSSSNVFFEYKLESVQLIAVTFRSIPSQAKLFIDNMEKGLTDFGDYFYPGKYKVRVLKSGYLDYEEEINIDENGDNKFTYKLTKNRCYLQLTVNPSDAEVKINDQLYKEKNIELKPGQYNIEVFKAGFLPKTEMITLILGDTLRKSYDLSKNAALLNLSIVPKDVTILLNKKDYTDQNSIELAPGLYKLELSKDSYYPISEPIELKLGDNINKSYSLVQKVGSLRFKVQPLNASVELKSGEQTIQNWQGMNQITDLPVGIYTVICKVEGFKSQIKNISITENIITTESVILEAGKDFVNVSFTLNESFDLWLDNKSFGQIANGSKSLETGKHFVKLKTDDEIIENEVFIDDSGIQTVRLESESSFPILLQSAVVPGLGQLTSGRTLYGVSYFAAFGAAATWHYLNITDYNDKKEDLNNKLDKFNTTASQSEKYNLGLEINELSEDVNKAYDKTKISIWAPIVVYAINILDAIIYPTPRHIVLSENSDIKIHPNIVIDYKGNIYGGLILEL
jgi:Family of unknown function (DUF5683)/PEGA domain